MFMNREQPFHHQEVINNAHDRRSAREFERIHAQEQERDFQARQNAAAAARD